MSTNGTRSINDEESAGAMGHPSSPFDDGATSDRLAALKQTIQSWDWRTALDDAGTPPAEASRPDSQSPVPEDGATSGHSDAPGWTSTSADVLERQQIAEQPPAQRPTPAETTSAVADLPVLPEPLTRAFVPAETPPASVPAPAATVTRDSASSPPAPGHVDNPVDHRDAASWVGLEPEIKPESGSRRSRRRHERLWTKAVQEHPWIKGAVMGAAAVVVVLLIIMGIRLVARGGSAPPAPAPVNKSASSQAHHVVVPISASDLAKFKGYAAGIDKANTVATRALVDTNTTPSLSKVTAVVSTYRGALNLYYFQLHFIHWPASMASATQIDYGQLSALLSFLQAFSSVDSAGIAPWVSQLHNRTEMAQTADNEVRQALGLPATSTFP